MNEIDGRYNEREEVKIKSSTDRSRMDRESRDGAVNRARDAVHNVSNSAGEMVGVGVQRTEEAIATVGQKISHFGDTIKETMPDSGKVGTAAVSLADGLKSSGEYLQTHGFKEMSNDVTDVIRRHPIPAACIGLGAGFILGRALVRK